LYKLITPRIWNMPLTLNLPAQCNEFALHSKFRRRLRLKTATILAQLLRQNWDWNKLKPSNSSEENLTWKYKFTQLIHAEQYRFLYSSLTNKCNILLKLEKFKIFYIKIHTKSLLHVSVYDHHQGACTEPS
jgi:hypothetical protein